MQSIDRLAQAVLSNPEEPGKGEEKEGLFEGRGNKALKDFDTESGRRRKRIEIGKVRGPDRRPDNVKEPGIVTDTPLRKEDRVS